MAAFRNPAPFAQVRTSFRNPGLSRRRDARPARNTPFAPEWLENRLSPSDLTGSALVAGAKNESGGVVRPTPPPPPPSMPTTPTPY